MEERGDSRSFVFASETQDDSLCAMYFGMSCAFFALKSLSNQSSDDQTCLQTRDKMLQGSAHLLGLLVWKRVQGEESKSIEKHELIRKLELAEREIFELKRSRSEDAKANEKVASIYAAQEQTWFAERRKLRHQVASLLNDLRVFDKRKNETISDLNKKVGEMEVVIKSKEKLMEELEEKVKCSEKVLEELRETNKREVQDHSCELMKHKTAVIELVSNQRQLEAELGRTLRQVEAAKQQLEFMFEEKEEAVLMVEELSIEIEKTRKESEQKDRFFEAMLRKIKLDSPEKQMVLKEVKLFKPKRKMNERKTERLGSFPCSRSERHTLRNFLSRQVSSRLLEAFPYDDREGNMKLEQHDAGFDDFEGEVRKQNQDYSQDFPEEFDDQATRLDEWVHAEAEKYHNAVEQRHQLELDASEEQVRMKDDKLEACRWQLLSVEVESKRLQSKIEGLNQEISQLRDHNLRLETLLVEREVEVKTMKDNISMHLSNLSAQRSKKHSSRKPAEKELQLKKVNEQESLSKHTSSSSFSSIEEIEVKDILEGSEAIGKEVTTKMCLNKINASPWKVDLHALGVTYKIKRLNQQLLMLDRLTGNPENNEFKGFCLLISLLKKQVGRYQSLQEKTDDLSKRMGDKDINIKRGVSSSKRSKEEKRKLEHFLEETFQLQRYIVATGQKLMEVQLKIGSGFDGIASELDGLANFDMKRFGETMQTLFKDVQRGLEVRISRIIGDLEGTLAYEGIHFLK